MPDRFPPRPPEDADLGFGCCCLSFLFLLTTGAVIGLVLSFVLDVI